MTSIVSDRLEERMDESVLAGELANRLEQGARALAEFARDLPDAQWRAKVPKDGRTAGVIVHHVASVYPLEVQLAQQIARGEAIAGVTIKDVHAMNAQHAVDYGEVSKEEALDLLARNSRDAARSIRQLSQEELLRAAPVSLYEDAPLTCQFVLEDHAVRHSYHHLGILQRTFRTDPK